MCLYLHEQMITRQSKVATPCHKLVVTAKLDHDLLDHPEVQLIGKVNNAHSLLHVKLTRPAIIVCIFHMAWCRVVDL